MKLLVPCVIWLCWLPLVAGAADGTLFDVYSLQAEAETEVVNDQLSVSFVVESEDRDTAVLASRINADMQWALTTLKRFPKVRSSTRDYRTWPRYEVKTNRIIGWFASQTLQLESDDFDQARDAIQVLQEKLQIRGMRMSAKPETRQQAEDDLISQALKRFRERAGIIQRSQGASAFRVMNVSVSASNDMPGYYPEARALAMEADVAAAPAIEGGTSRVMVRIDGQIQLQ